MASTSPNRLTEKILILFILLLAAAVHGVNLFGFPYRESDEGTYMGQAWSVSHEHRLSPYTYWYDHSPAGWIQIAAWSRLTGGFHSFGSPIDTGRVLILLMHIAS